MTCYRCKAIAGCFSTEMSTTLTFMLYSAAKKYNSLSCQPQTQMKLCFFLSVRPCTAMVNTELFWVIPHCYQLIKYCPSISLWWWRWRCVCVLSPGIGQVHVDRVTCEVSSCPVITHPASNISGQSCMSWIIFHTSEDASWFCRN